MPKQLIDLALNMLKKSLFLISFLVLGLFAFGCAEESPRPTKENYITFTDSLNRTVSVKERPKNVVALTGSFAEVWQLSGGRVVGTAEDAWTELSLELDGAISIGGAHSPNFEIILGIDPDFVIASSSNASNVALLDSLNAAGITVGYFNVRNFKDYLNMLDICTDITGNKDKYRENGTKLSENIDKILSDFEAKSIPKSQKNILLLRASGGSIKVKNSDSVLGEMLLDFGYNNIADNNSTLLESLNTEAIIKENPFHIFVVTMGDDTEKAKNNFYKMIEENPAWSSLDAVANNRIHIMDKKLFNLKPNHRWAKAYEILSETLQSN